MNTNQNSRLSRTSQITNRNIHAVTDALYQPLRSTLQRVSISPNIPRDKSPLKSVASRVSARVKQLTPLQAEQLKKSTFIPIDKKLVATKNLSKVQGKIFTAVSVEERVMPALTQQEMQVIALKRPMHQQTLYQFQTQSQLPYQSQPLIDSDYQFPTKSNFYHQNHQQSPLRQIVQNLEPMHSFNPNFNQYGQLYHQYYNTAKTTKNRKNVFLEIHPPIIRNSSVISNKSVSQKDKSIRNMSRQNPIKPKSSYKYNLYSVLDHAVNSKCQSCGDNQIVAKIPS